MIRKTSKLLSNILIGAIIGGFLGTKLLFPKVGEFIFLKITPLLAFIPITISGTILGTLIGGGIGGLFGFTNTHIDRRNKIQHEPKEAHVNGAKIQLHREQLEIAKKWLRTGKVKVHQEISTEQKVITVPVTREDLIIEKTVFDGTVPPRVESFRIPIRSEYVEISKRPILLGKISIYKHRLQEFQQVEEILKQERVHVETDGECILIDTESGEND